MNTATTLGAFALGLVAVFGASTALGSAVGPIGPAAGGKAPAHGGGGGHAEAEVAPLPAGLAAAQDGYRLELDSAATVVGPQTLAFTVTGPDGHPLTTYTPTHDKDLHLVVVRRDLSGFQHVHPTRAADGTWSVPLTLTAPGAYKVFTDFAPGGQEKAVILGTDLLVAGDATPLALPAVARAATVDGYTVSLEGDLVAGTESELSLQVSRAGSPVTPQPYLGALGHLVALRPGDLAYLHVHPTDGLRFGVDVPTSGTYRLFLDFRHGEVVRTAAFTAVAR